MQPKLSCYFASFCWKYYGFQQLPLINLYLEYAKTSVIIMSICNMRRVWEKFARPSCYCDVDTCNSAESNLQAPTAKLRFDSHQSNFRRQAESWPKTTDAEINIHYITYQTALWFPRYNWTLHRWKAMESVMSRFRPAKPILFFRWVNLAWACNPIKNQYLFSGQLQENNWPRWALNLSSWYGHNTGQQILCFDRCQLTITWVSNIKVVRCNYSSWRQVCKYWWIL